VLHDREKPPFGFISTVMRLGVIRNTSFFETDLAQTCVMRPAAIRRLGVTGKMPVLPEGWTPSKI